jgi:hypothetical protein
MGKGLVFDHGDGKQSLIAESEMPPTVLEKLQSQHIKQDSIIVLKLFHHFLEDPIIQAMLFDIIPSFKLSKRMLIILSPVLKIPAELEKELALVVSDLPDKDTIGKVLNGIIEGTPVLKKETIDPDIRKQLIESALGLNTPESENALALALVRPKLQKSGKRWDPTVVMEEKCNTLKKTGLLQYYPPTGLGMKQIGGMGNLKDWMAKRKRVFTDEARTYGLPYSKGILMLGLPGTGKSLGAKAIAEELKLPLLRCDLGKVFAGLVGASEENIRRVIQTAEAVAPVILWIDEIEKGLAGSSGSGSTDSGVSARVLGTLLTWMSEKESPVFIYATANDVSALRPELLRKGRWDEIFYVALPNLEERKEIFKVHLEKRNRGHLIEKLNLDLLAGSTEEFSGAEIEACIVDGMFSSFADNKELNSWDLSEAIKATVPLSKMMMSQIKTMDDWCKGRARPANKAVASEVTYSRNVDA